MIRSIVDIKAAVLDWVADVAAEDMGAIADVSEAQWTEFHSLIRLYKSGASAPHGWHFCFTSNLEQHGCSKPAANLLATAVNRGIVG
jgi:hypothetical protein